MPDLLNVNINCVVLSTDIPQNKKYILSLDRDKIVLPTIQCTTSNIENLSQTITQYLRDIILVSEMEMLPQLISANEPLLPNKNLESMDIVYGFLVSFSPNLNNSFWVEFDHITPNAYTPLIIKVIQNLS